MEVCKEEQEYINFFQAYWCDLDGNNFAMGLLLILCAVIIFRFLSIAVEEYIAEGVENLAELIHLPPNLASVTVSCAAVSAAEIVTSLVSSEMEGGISYNIGSIFGASLFVITIAVGFAIIQTKGKVRLSALVAKRDISFFVVATIMIIGMAFYKWITWWNSLMLLILYVCLIFSVFFSDIIKKRRLHKLKTRASIRPDDEEIKKKIDELEGHGHDHHYVETPRSVDSDVRHSVAQALGEIMITIGVQLTEAGGEENLQLDKEKIEKLADQLNAKLDTIKNFRKKKLTDLSPIEILIRSFD